MIDIRAFKETIPLVDPRLVPDSVGQTVLNCKTESGTLKPFLGSDVVNTPSKAGTKKTIYLYNNFWLHWLEDVDVARGPIAGDTTDRLYWTGEGVPKVSNASLITSGGGTEYPTVAYTLGIPTPDATPSVAIVGASVDPDLAESTSYVYTYVSGWGEEGPPSAASAILAVEPTQSVNISGMATAPTGAYNITHKRIYRTATGTSGTEFLYVATILVTATTYSDTTSTANLGESLLSTYWDAPPEAMHSLALHPSGFMVGISGNDICFSVQYMPHAWPESYRIPISDTPIGLGVFGNSVLVVTDSKPYAITGTDPSYMMKEQLEINQSCVSKSGIVDVGNAVAYPAPDGLILIGQGVAKNITESIYTREQWQALSPSDMIGAFHDGRYYGFSNSGGIVLDFSESGVRTIDTDPSAAYADPEEDALFLQVGNDIVQWDATGEANQELVWKSKIFVKPVPTVPPGVIKILASGYPISLKFYADGVLKLTKSVTSGEPFRVAGGYYSSEDVYEITSTKEIKRFTAAATMAEMKRAG